MNYKITEGLNDLLDTLVYNIYNHLVNIESNSQIIFFSLLCCVLYLMFYKVYNFKKSHTLPYFYSAGITIGYIMLWLVGIYYFLSIGLSITTFGLAYFLDRLDTFKLEIFFPSVVVFFTLFGITIVLDFIFINRFREQKILNPLNRISNEYIYKVSGKKEYNPEVRRIHCGEFNPLKYYREGLLFHGLNEFKKPVYTKLIESLDGHICITGGTGAGKGVQTRLFLSQFIRYGVKNIIFDVKPDKYLYNLCAEECKNTNQKMYVIDIDTRLPQIQLFAGINNIDFETIISSAMELEPQKQTNARVYAQRTETALITIAEHIYKQGMTPAEIIKACDDYDIELLSENEDLRALLYNLSRYKVFNSIKSPSIQDILHDNAVLYIRASSAKENPASSLILRLLFQTITKEIQYNDLQKCIFLDEFKFIMTTAVMNQLATIRDFKTTLMVNFQAFSNFETSPNKAMNNKAYGKELLDNMHIFALGNTSDTETIEIVQKRGGQTTYDKAFENEEARLGGGTETSEDRKYTKHVDYKLTPNEIANGDKKTMILLAPQLLRNKEYEKISTYYIPTENYTFNITQTFEEKNIHTVNQEKALDINNEIKTPQKNVITKENKHDNSVQDLDIWGNSDDQ